MAAIGRLVWVTSLLAIAIGLVNLAADAARPPADAEPGAPSLVGRLLVATPDLDDTNFSHTVVYLIDHDAGGAMGLVINRVLGKGPLGKLLAGFGIDADVDPAVEIDVHYGGPVERGRGFVLHTPDYTAEGTLVVSELAAVSDSRAVLRDIGAGKGPRRSLFALGYAGWGPEQLEREIAAGAWYVVEADERLLYDEQLDHKWKRALERRGIDL